MICFVGKLPDYAVVWGKAQADRRPVASGGIAEAVVGGKSIQSLEGTEGCPTKPHGKAAVNACGTRVEADASPCRAPLESLDTSIVLIVGVQNGNS
jgi:hypothetical protein